MERFQKVALDKYFNSTVDVQGWADGASEVIKRSPDGDQSWGIPFDFGPRNGGGPAFIELKPGVDPVSIPLSGKATHVCIVQIANRPNDLYVDAARGETLAEYIVKYTDGREHIQPIRMRFEVNCWGEWGRYAFAAQPANMPSVMEDDATKYGWGPLQQGVDMHWPEFSGWVYALELPDSEVQLESITLMPVSGLMAVSGITLYNGPDHPLRHVPRRVYKLVLPDAVAQEDLKTELDMGVVIRTYAVPCHVDESWLNDPNAGLGLLYSKPGPSNEFIVEATGALGAVLSVKAGGSEANIDFGRAFEEGKASDGDVRIEMLDGKRQWVRVTVIDTTTGSPTPTRVHFRGTHGEYIAPYGHHEMVNDRWFEDYAGDLQLGNMSFAYVPGEFQIELPQGDVYVEIWKGFEYSPVRQKLHVKSGQRDLKLGISRWTDQRSKSWVTADTHVHFISPETAWLEGQAEGVNLINLLASQWGKLFTNVADISGAMNGSSRDDTIVWVGTENRNHLLGHISMLGTKGDPVFPMCAGGPSEAWIGDPDQMLLTEWADICKQREGVVVRPHFPSPICEEPVYMMLEKMDGLELRHFQKPDAETLDMHHFIEYYRYLNCGCRVAAVGGTDKMSAGMPVGGVRTYAKIDPNEGFSFESWGKAVREGRTFTTSGPIVDLTVDGYTIGDEIQIPTGGASLEVKAEAECWWPMHKMEIVVNGKVVASTYCKEGSKKLTIEDKIKVDGSCWVAARVSSDHLAHHVWTINLGAHTSPIYVVAGGQEVFTPSDANYMLTLIDGGLTYLDTLSVRYDNDRHLAMKAIFEQARQVIHRKMHEHGMDHGH